MSRKKAERFSFAKSPHHQHFPARPRKEEVLEPPRRGSPIQGGGIGHSSPCSNEKNVRETKVLMFTLSQGAMAPHVRCK